MSFFERFRWNLSPSDDTKMTQKFSTPMVYSFSTFSLKYYGQYIYIYIERERERANSIGLDMISNEWRTREVSIVACERSEKFQSWDTQKIRIVSQWQFHFHH